MKSEIEILKSEIEIKKLPKIYFPKDIPNNFTHRFPGLLLFLCDNILLYNLCIPYDGKHIIRFYTNNYTLLFQAFIGKNIRTMILPYPSSDLLGETSLQDGDIFSITQSSDMIEIHTEAWTDSKRSSLEDNVFEMIFTPIVLRFFGVKSVELEGAVVEWTNNKPIPTRTICRDLHDWMKAIDQANGIMQAGNAGPTKFFICMNDKRSLSIYFTHAEAELFLDEQKEKFSESCI